MANSNARDGARLVLLALAEHADRRGYSHPSVATLGRLCALTDRQVQRALKRLREDCEIYLAAPGGGRNRPSLYQITPPGTAPFNGHKG